MSSIPFNMGASSGPINAELSARIFRVCRCGAPNPLGLTRCTACGRKTVIEDRGMIAQWHANPFIRIIRDLKIRWAEFVRLYREL